MGLKIVFVCGGNTCRSPMAAALAAHALKEIADVTSAGVAAYFPGRPLVFQFRRSFQQHAAKLFRQS